MNPFVRFRWSGKSQVIPASFFSESDWRRRLQTIARKLPEK